VNLGLFYFVDDWDLDEKYSIILSWVIEGGFETGEQIWGDFDGDVSFWDRP
jgi:hypothetical protein